jgi:hypothetical protein
MASRYDALANHLEQQRGPRYTVSFAKIEQLVGHPLPPSSRPPHKGWRTWWGNVRSPNSQRSQATFGWLAAGWEVETVDPDQETVTFRRSRGAACRGPMT